MPAGKITNNRTRINKIYGFAIGIDEYEDKSLNLNGCVNDARNIMKAFNPNEQIILTNEQATRKGILATVSTYIGKLKKGDLLVISVSAHGVEVNKIIRDLAIAPYDAERSNILGTVLSSTYLINILCDISENGCKILLIIDICRAGILYFDLSKYSSILGGGISAIFACGPNEQAKEMRFGENMQGAFTKYLVDGLNGGADFDGLKIITLRDLFDFVYKNVCKTVKDQHPALIGMLEGNIILNVIK